MGNVTVQCQIEKRLHSIFNIHSVLTQIDVFLEIVSSQKTAVFPSFCAVFDKRGRPRSEAFEVSLATAANPLTIAPLIYPNGGN